MGVCVLGWFCTLFRPSRSSADGHGQLGLGIDFENLGADGLKCLLSVIKHRKFAMKAMLQESRTARWLSSGIVALGLVLRLCLGTHSYSGVFPCPAHF